MDWEALLNDPDPRVKVLLDHPVGVLTPDNLSVRQYNEFEKMIAGRLTVREVVRAAALGKYNPSVRKWLGEAVAAKLMRPAPTAPAGVAPFPTPATRDSVIEWAKANGLASLLLWRGEDLRSLLPLDLRPANGGWPWMSAHQVFEDYARIESVTSWMRELLIAIANLAAAGRARQDRYRDMALPEDPLVREALARWDARIASVDLPDFGYTAEFFEDPSGVEPCLRARVVGVAHMPFQLHIRRGEYAPPPAPLTATFAHSASCRLREALLDASDPHHALVIEELHRPTWRRAFARLDDLLATSATWAAAAADEEARELGWRVQVHGPSVHVSPVLWRAKKTGSGVVARAVLPRHIPEGLLRTDADLLASELLAIDDHRQNLHVRAVDALVGHPAVMDTKNNPLTVRRARLSLRVRYEGDGVALEALIDGQPAPVPLGGAWSAGRLVRQQGALIQVMSVSVDAYRFTELSLPHLVDLPAEAIPELLLRLAPLERALPLALPPELAGEPVPGDPRPLLRLVWASDALTVEVRLRPLPDAAAHLPGEGPSELHAIRGSRRVAYSRELEAEPGQVRAALASLPFGGAQEDRPFAFTLPSIQRALELVEALATREHDFQIEWSGPLLRLAPPLEAKRLKIEVESGRDWFGVKGALDELSLEAIAAAIAEGASFVQVKGGQWARIAQSLREPLAALAAVGAARDGLRVSALHVAVIEALEGEGAQLKAPATWRQAAARLTEARALVVELPLGLKAELRPYQREGFTWLARLAHWAPGAILADDMGLGKTLQAIALLLHRREAGPALVVAPTSVVFNWAAELARFAPDLAVHTYHGGGRAELLAEARPGAVLLTTWGVLQRDAEALKSQTFATLVLDEAQAIKNPTTQRALAAFALNADFRVALSGTPVENRALDLWSLLRATVPGLLGTPAQFRDRFLAGDNRSNRRALASVVRPFVLRRTKREVATDLPERSEVVVTVELSDAERALYDRARAVAVAQLQDETPNPQARFAVLAALTKLRQLACHPRLVDAGSPVRSSKLQLLLRMLEDVREGGHRALVFSQFVEHLKLVREAVLAAGFRVRQIDGSTPLAERRREVDAFQAGDGDVFLISLKAGGVGLNLTAATYVFHLDPWWNPAAEDQASDRAHRIGQTEPVTIYRLVSKGTIEDAILALHADKRTLAADLLAGADTPATLDVEALIGLLAGG